MDFHLIVKHQGYQKWRASFSKTIHPEIDEYIRNSSIHKLTCLKITTDEIIKIVINIEKVLNTFFTGEYIHQEFKSIRPKSIQEVSYLGKIYYIHITSVNYRRIKLLELLNNLIKNNDTIILYEERYLEYRLLQILRCINDEELKNKIDIIARIDSIRHPDFNVDEALKELEEKEFVIIDNQEVLLTEKGKI